MRKNRTLVPPGAYNLPIPESDSKIASLRFATPSRASETPVNLKLGFSGDPNDYSAQSQEKTNGGYGKLGSVRGYARRGISENRDYNNQP